MSSPPAASRLTALFNQKYSHNTTGIVPVPGLDSVAATPGAHSARLYRDCMQNASCRATIELDATAAGDAGKEPVQDLAMARGGDAGDAGDAGDVFKWSTVHNEKNEMAKKVEEMQNDVFAMRNMVRTAMRMYRPLHAFVNYTHAQADALPYDVADAVPIMCLKKYEAELKAAIAEERKRVPSCKAKLERVRKQLLYATQRLAIVQDIVELFHGGVE